MTLSRRRQRAFVASVASGGLLLASLTPLATAALAQAQVPAPAPQVVPPNTDPEPGYATKQRPLVTVDATGKTTVVRNGDALNLTMSGVTEGEFADGGRVYRVVGARNVVIEWNRLRAKKRDAMIRGAILGEAKDGREVRTWVKFGKARLTKGKVKVQAYPTEGKVDPLVREKTKYTIFSAKKTFFSAKTLKSVTLAATDSQSKKWQFSGTGKTGSITQTGNTFEISVNGVGNQWLGGVQPNGRAAAIKANHLASGFANMLAKGVKPRLVLAGQAGKKDFTELFFPQDVSFKGGDLIIKAKMGSTIPKKLLADMAKTIDLGFMFDVANPGQYSSFVLVTGDSIASGEGASMGGTYLNGNLGLDTNPTVQNLQITKGGISADRTIYSSGHEVKLKVLAAVYAQAALTLPIPVTDSTQIERWKLFCGAVDLACTSAKVVNGKLQYKRDPGIVYEKGSYEDSVQKKYNFTCHRSKTAPGTWLARYYKEVRGLDIEPVNLACSGATTANILSKTYVGERPQVEQVEALADWLPVTDIVNTIGANDLGFSDIAKDCVFAPINALLPLFTGGGNKSLVDLLFPDPKDGPTPLALLTDDVRRKGDTVESANVWFKTDGLCSQSDREKVRNRLKTLPGKIADVLQALHKAAPDARIIQSNYPNEVPASKNTYFPRQQWWGATRTNWLQTGDVGLVTGDNAGYPLLGVNTSPFATFNGPTGQKDYVGNYVSPTGWRSWLIDGGGANCPGKKGLNLSSASPPSYPICPDVASKYPDFPSPTIDGDVFFDTVADPKAVAHNTARAISQNLYSFGEIQAGIGAADLWYASSVCSNDGATPGAETCLGGGKGTGAAPDPKYVPQACLFPSETVAGKKICVWKGSTLYTTSAKAPLDPKAAAAPLTNDTADSFKLPQWWFKFLTQGGILDTLAFGAIMYGLDQDWAATTVIPGLNTAVTDGVKKADPKGEWTTFVDQTQTFNGRELGSKFVGSKVDPMQQVFGYNPKNPTPANPKVAAQGPSGSRAQFVNNIFTQAKGFPIICPEASVITGEQGCPGSAQEALHPNWLGQAAMGQCIVAVVTGGFGQKGNACVRTIGDNVSTGEQYTASNLSERLKYGNSAMLFSEVDGTDAMCLDSLSSRSEYAKGTYTTCKVGINPMPTWSKDWSNGAVKWNGKDVRWG